MKWFCHLQWKESLSPNSVTITLPKWKIDPCPHAFTIFWSASRDPTSRQESVFALSWLTAVAHEHSRAIILRALTHHCPLWVPTRTLLLPPIRSLNMGQYDVRFPLPQCPFTFHPKRYLRPTDAPTVYCRFWMGQCPLPLHLLLVPLIALPIRRSKTNIIIIDRILHTLVLRLQHSQ